MENMNYLNIFIDTLTSDNTKVAYLKNITHMLNFVDKPEQEVKEIDLVGWSNSLKSCGLSSSAQHQHIVSVRSYFRFLKKMKLVESNPALELDTPKVVNKPKDFITQEEMSVIANNIVNERDKAIFITLNTTGLRVSELINLKLSDFGKDKINILGKGNKYRSIYLSPICIEAILDYLTVRKDGCDNLFVSNQNTPMREENINKMMKKWAKKSGVNKNIMPHSARHTCATTICEKYGVSVAQMVLGHSDIRTTQRYIHTDENIIKEAMMSMSI